MADYSMSEAGLKRLKSLEGFNANAPLVNSALARKKALERFMAGPADTLPTAQEGLTPESMAAADAQPEPEAEEPQQDELIPTEAPKGAGWKKGLAAALQGATGAITANIGPAIQGQDFRQGILRGIVGGGIVSAGMARQQAEKAKAESEMGRKLAVIRYEKGYDTGADLDKLEKELKLRKQFEKTPAEKAAEAAAVAEAEFPTKEKLANVQGEIVNKRMQALKTQAINAASGEDDARLWAKAWDQAIAEGKMSYETDSGILTGMARRNYTNMKKPQGIKFPKLED